MAFLSTDLTITGGGPGGVGAAIAAARSGVSTTLVERFGCLGGTWTSGILSAIMPFPYVRGIFLEIIERLEQRGGWRQFEHIEPNMTAADIGKNHAGGCYDSEILKVVLDEMLSKAGVDVLFFSQLAGVRREGSRVRSINVLTKQGFLDLEARFFIDSSGDGDLCALAGVPFEVGREEDGATQPMTLIFKMDGVDDERALVFRRLNGNLGPIWQAAKARGEVTIRREDVLWNPMPKPGQWNFNTTRILGKDPGSVRDLSAAMIEGRRQAGEVAAFMRGNVPGFEAAVISETAPHVGIRESRRIMGDYVMNADDIIKAAVFPDPIARGNWFVDIHSPDGEGTRHVHAPAGKYYEIPYRSIRPRGLDNVLVASRCISATHEAHAAVRITPQVVAIGQGAGTAAAMAIAGGEADSRSVDGAALREQLRRDGAF